MKKTLLTAALILASITGFNAAAQSTNTDSTTKTECVKAKDGDCCKADKKDGKRGAKDCDRKGGKKDGKQADRKGGKHGDKHAKIFESLNLTDAQKSQLEALKAERKAAKEAAKTEAKAKGEKAAKPTEEQCQQARADFDKKIQNILTPEQYKQYTEKKAEMKAQKEAKAGKKNRVNKA
ncbi:MAG: Spy/CpxP family protein refolding chaperone [Bacteroidales bacterium]|nr:Spy/CpxP family protein refolding chaperone [Bacteroidales bacterium]